MADNRMKKASSGKNPTKKAASYAFPRSNIKHCGDYGINESDPSVRIFEQNERTRTQNEKHRRAREEEKRRRKKRRNLLPAIKRTEVSARREDYCDKIS